MARMVRCDNCGKLSEERQLDYNWYTLHFPENVLKFGTNAVYQFCSLACVRDWTKAEIGSGD